MRRVEVFLKDFPNVDNNLFTAPTCPDFEERHQKILSLSFDPLTGDFTETTVSGRLYIGRALYLNNWQEVPQTPSIILVKNPRNLRGLGLGERNALVYTGETGYLYAAVVMHDIVYIKRPVVPKFQAPLRADIKKVLSGVRPTDLLSFGT